MTEHSANTHTHLLNGVQVEAGTLPWSNDKTPAHPFAGCPPHAPVPRYIAEAPHKTVRVRL